jgi:hypothetical protein
VARLAAKRLSAVEIRPGASHQHEFHAGKLRGGLGFGDEAVRGRLRLVVFGDESDEPVVDEDAFTLYDARAAHPTRSEWHLYYYSSIFEDAAEPGDLLVLYRPDDSLDLHGVVLRQGSEREQSFLDAMDLGAGQMVDQFRLLDPEAPSPAARRRVGEALTLWEEESRSGSEIAEYPASEHPIVSRAIRERALPPTLEMAMAAADLARGQLDPVADPDNYLLTVLETETRLFRTIEAATAAESLRAMWAARPNVADVLEWAMRVHQARRSRRGQSLQHHFAGLLRANDLPFGAQCRTEPGETPDFLVPSCEAYADPRFPSGKLRMVACKTTSKERWRQVLNEARRIPEKYLLTLDERLSLATVTEMRAASLRVFIPEPLLASVYDVHPMRASLGDVSELLKELAAVTM